MHILGEEMNCASKVTEWQVLPHVMHQICKRAVCQRAQGLMCGPTLSQEHILVKQPLHVRNKLCNTTHKSRKVRTATVLAYSICHFL
jgi:hypothetical protein